mgnify:CR=1 FL=1
MNNIYDIHIKDSSNKEVSMSKFEGKTLLIVNVASKCGLTPQYKGLQSLYEEYKDRNFVVLGFPCNQFGGQEPGTNSEINNFCEINYSVTFRTESIKWNFTKFLVNSSGKIIDRFSPRVEPKYIRSEIERIL